MPEKKKKDEGLEAAKRLFSRDALKAVGSTDGGLLLWALAAADAAYGAEPGAESFSVLLRGAFGARAAGWACPGSLMAMARAASAFMQGLLVGASTFPGSGVIAPEGGGFALGGMGDGDPGNADPGEWLIGLAAIAGALSGAAELAATREPGDYGRIMREFESGDRGRDLPEALWMMLPPGRAGGANEA